MNKLKRVINSKINYGNYEYMSKKRGISYLYTWLNSIINNKNSNIFNFNLKFNLFKGDPKISVIMPIYNSEKSGKLWNNSSKW